TAHQLAHYAPPSPVHTMHQHSFPTRRSSDLNINRKLYARDGTGLASVANQDFVRYPRMSTHRSSSKIPRKPLRKQRLRRRRQRLDRKSTRLNSSHVKISYAVFCLKKKSMRWY